ncbi:hypothetical protein [Achromobacter mucicolens]|uniref:hypothetical protein n=1 Tax=Achromobacter mucicolens TaxID=1389922 RepID=UPI0028AA75D6|nr:hypothetical protein [Achromobacter mucicolens]
MNPHLSLRMRVFCCSDGAGLGVRLGTPSAGSAWLGCIPVVIFADLPGDIPSIRYPPARPEGAISL